jgi:hypothetical protein
VKSKEKRNIELKIIPTHTLGDGIRHVSEWEQLLMGSCEVLFLQMKPNLVSNQNFLLYQMLIVVLPILGIGVLHNIRKLLLYVLDVLNKFGYSIKRFLSMGGIFMCNCNKKIYINGGQWLEPKAHLKRVVL